MSVILAYIVVVLIWSTTPLGIVWSSDSVSPSLAVLARMVIGTCFALSFLVIKRISLPMHKQAWLLYGYSGIGIFGGMMFSYLAAQSLPSGMMSLIFGMAPILSGLLAQKILHEAKFGRYRKWALLIALSGLALSCSDTLTSGHMSLKSLFYISMGVFFFSLSGVMIKSLTVSIHPLANTTGALLFSLPLFFICWWLMDGELNIDQWSLRASLSILYLGVFASFIGFVAYFYILQKLTASTVALVTMMTPVLALILGNLLNDEKIGPSLIAGAVLIIGGLALYQSSMAKKEQAAMAENTQADKT